MTHNIYTDWANYYLERAKSKRKVSDLSADCRDGLLLAEVIEAVTTFKVPDLVKKPKTAQHMSPMTAWQKKQSKQNAACATAVHYVCYFIL
uniref:Calponin-homology (CH) domain-containing protein n=1 Tax=Anopheles christyi TaxID=43041 RepID=A0A182JYX5_9DIPT